MYTCIAYYSMHDSNRNTGLMMWRCKSEVWYVDFNIRHALNLKEKKDKKKEEEFDEKKPTRR